MENTARAAGEQFANCGILRGTGRKFGRIRRRLAGGLTGCRRRVMHEASGAFSMPNRSSTLAAPPAQFDLPGLEEGILSLWDQNEAERRSLRRGAEASERGADEAYVFFDGPPFATGLPHYGHILPGTIKDIVPRYFTMKGLAVERRFGWDCHGLPIESLVESQLGLTGAAEIEAFGLKKFNTACRAGVLKYTGEWQATVRRMGRWVDFDNDYKTMDLSFMETVWWVFRQLWDGGRIYEGHRVQPVSPALGTPLSNFEVAQGPQERDPVTRKDGHRRRQDPSITVRFKLTDEDAFVWAWTTTPWTLTSNLALAVHPDFEYVQVKVLETGEIAYLERTRMCAYREAGKLGEVEELTSVQGRELVGRTYEPLFPYFVAHREAHDGHAAAFRIVPADYVTTDRGTGVVHQATAFGEEDYHVGRKESLPIVNPLNLRGVFDARVTDFAGMFAKDADKGIIQKLKAEGKLVDQDTIVHPYPHCYRTDQPLLYMALSTWFMEVEPLREQLVANNEEIRWVPDHVGSGRFGNWLGGARDWNLARNRYWGTPLPIWRCEQDPTDVVCVGSVSELEELASLKPGSLTDIHRETVDAIVFPSAKTPGGRMRRVKEVFDCWFESGSMPYAQNHYPFDPAKKRYVEDNLPADFIAEGLDQTRGWFYTLHVLAAALFGRPAFKNVIVNGLVLAEDGKKMSKRLKNYPDPQEVVHKYGADALRAYLINSAAVKAEPMRFSEHGVRDTVRMVVLPLWNAYNFLATYACADGWSPSAADLSVRPRGALDRWILSRLQAFIDELSRQFENYTLFNVVPAFQRICEDLNNWYIRRGRRRYWRARDAADDSANDKSDADGTLYCVLVTITHAIAPVMPFFSEWLYLRLVADAGLAGDEVSVHERDYPRVEEDRRNQNLDAQVAAVRQAVGLGMAARERAKLPVRRPLARVTIASADGFIRTAMEAFREDVLGELNVKDLELLEDDAGLVTLSAKANFKVLGKRLGKKMKAVASGVAAMDAAAITAYTASGSAVIQGEILSRDDLLIVREAQPGRAAESAEGMTVVIETDVSRDLVLEGLAREIVNRVQNLRKAAALDVSQPISLTVAAAGDLAHVIASPELVDLIKGETLCTDLSAGEEAAVRARRHSASDSVDGDGLHLGLDPL